MSFSRKRSFTFGAYGGVDRFTHGDEARTESSEDSMLDILDSPASESKSFITASSNQRDTELFEIIEKLQGSRIDEQRCEFPLPLKSQDLTIGGDLPLVLPSESGGYWIDPPLERLVDVSPTSCQHGLHPERYDIMERDGEARIYHTFFRSRHHHSFTAADPCLGPLVLSVCLEEEENRLRVILRFCSYFPSKAPLRLPPQIMRAALNHVIMCEERRRREAPLLTSDLSLTGAFTGAI